MRAFALTVRAPWAPMIVAGTKGGVEFRPFGVSWRGWFWLHEARPVGAITAAVELVDVVPWAKLSAAQLRAPGASLAIERYGAKALGWVLGGVIALDEPVPARGLLGVWALPPPVEASAIRALALAVAGRGRG